MSVTSATPETVSLRSLVGAVRAGKRFACLTCYDATTATWLERAGIEVLLVGDTAAEMILGLPSTIHAPLDFMVSITRAVKRGAPTRLVMADMPFMSYQANEDDALRNAARFLTEGMADCVKVEVDRTWAPLVGRMVRAGIPVVAHVGSRPQQTKVHGGCFSVGRTAEQAVSLLHDAAALEAAGACMLLVEACPGEVTSRIVERATIPVIGCGAGPACHGQVIVLHDLLGLSSWQPGFAKPMASLGASLQQTAQAWRDRVHQGHIDNTFNMRDSEAERLRLLLQDGAQTHAKA